MKESASEVLLWFSALGCGLIAGLYFAFSAFIMTALGQTDPAVGTAAMNAINSTILRSTFIPLFFGTTLTSALLAILALFQWSEPGTALMLIGGLGYLLGMFGVTVAFNVPLNNQLAKAESGEKADNLWARYLNKWTVWNHVRTVASTVACGCFIAALVVRAGTTT